MSRALVSVAIRQERDVVLARRRAREVAALLGFEPQDQTRIATAVSEIARNAARYAGSGRVEFLLEGSSAPQLLLIRVSDQGPGIPHLAQILHGEYRSTTGMGVGIIGSQRLMDQVDIRTTPGTGTEVVLKKMLPARVGLISTEQLGRMAMSLSVGAPADALDELQEQNRELVRAFAELRERQDELLHVNRELEDTNRGVVALYAELDEKADHLRRADEMKSRFLSNMSHEFRTPLNAIRALSRLLLERSDGELNGEQERQVGYISKAADDLTALVDDLLDLAKIEAGKVQVHAEEFSVSKLFSALRGMLRPLLVAEDVRLVFEEPDPALELVSDEGKISQILRNFISNAIKFTERGEIRISARLEEATGQVAFSVADTGIGISEADQSLIFEEFTQLPNPIQKRVKGTGLGLPLCRRLARLLGGDVVLESVLAQGSTFTAVLPQRYRSDSLDGACARDVPAELGRMPVLIVEDDAQTRELYARYLRDSPYQPLCAATVREARALMQQLRPRALVLDILLPGHSGWTWLNELKARPGQAGIPVLIATSVDDERKALALGAEAYCRKPVSQQQLLEQLHRLTGQRVLVIEDDPAARYLLQKYLAAPGYSVLEAEDGRSGLIAARRAKPSMIILDLGLPDMSGERVLEILKSDAELRSVPVTVVTAAALTAEERERLTTVAARVISKSELGTEHARESLCQARP